MSVAELWRIFEDWLRNGTRCGTAGAPMRPGILRAALQTVLVELKGVVIIPNCTKLKSRTAAAF